jgi:hypothetical protein
MVKKRRWPFVVGRWLKAKNRRRRSDIGRR